MMIFGFERYLILSYEKEWARWFCFILCVIYLFVTLFSKSIFLFFQKIQA